MRSEISFKPLSRKRRGWDEATVAKSRKYLNLGGVDGFSLYCSLLLYIFEIIHEKA